MSLSRRSFSILAKIFAAAALLVAGTQLAVSQARGKGPLGLVRGEAITFTSPQFVVQALWFKANDETGWYWTGSDEVYAVFSDMDPTHYDRETSIYGNVDEGDLVNFKPADQCMAPQPNCDRGMADLNVGFSFWERDSLGLGLEFCPGDFQGSHTRLLEGKCTSDDFIGRGSIIYSRDDLVAMLPAVGDSREFTAVMDKDAGKYRFRYRITRLANVERSIIVHLPPDILTTPTISLQASVIVTGFGKAVHLTWSGATTSTVDIYRDAAKVATTANDGAHDDPVANGTYQYRICDLGSTTACSAQVTVVVT